MMIYGIEALKDPAIVILIRPRQRHRHPMPYHKDLDLLGDQHPLDPCSPCTFTSAQIEQDPRAWRANSEPASRRVEGALQKIRGRTVMRDGETAMYT